MTILWLLGGWLVLSVVVGCWFGMIVRTADLEERRTAWAYTAADFPAPRRRPLEATLR